MVDLDGKAPWILIPIIIGVVVGLTGCSNPNTSVEATEIEMVQPTPGQHEYQHSPEEYNSDEYRLRTSCYAYAFDVVNNPVTGEEFYPRNTYGLTFANQPGLFSEQPAGDIVSGTEESNYRLVQLVTEDARAIGLNFQEYEEGMNGGYAVLLVVSPGFDYHWYRQDADGTWSHKRGSTHVICGVEDPIEDAQKLGYTEILGYYYITEECNLE